MAVNYFCSGFAHENAFWQELASKLKKDLKDTKSIVYIPGNPKNIEKARAKTIPAFTEHFKNAGIEFEATYLITPDMDKEEAKGLVDNASFIMLMGGCPFKQKEMCDNLDILNKLKKYKGIMCGYSAGAMLMSKYIIITPCSEEYPEFRIEEGLNLAEISIYPHNNFEGDIYPEKVNTGEEIYNREDIIKVAEEYGDFYLLQDNLNEHGIYDVSLIRTCGDNIEFLIQNDGKVFKATKDGIELHSLDSKLNR